MDRRTFVVATGSAVSVSLAGCLDAGGEPTGEHDVGMTIDSFRPDSLTVQPGTTVEFRNTSSHTHTVTAFQDAYPDDAEYFASGGYGSEQAATDAWEDGGSGGLSQGDSFEHTFEFVGTYDYYCIPHRDAGMVGEIVVSEDA